MNNESMFIWSGQKCRRGELSPVLYCNNVAIIGEKVVDNRGPMINRGHKQQTMIKFASNRSKHWHERCISRSVSALDTITTMQHGIRFRSDIKKGNRWVKRAVYLWHHFFVCAEVHPKHLVTCYKIDPISKSAFELYMSLKKEENNTLRNCKIVV